MKPVDFLEIIWTREFVDLQWDIIRFRRIKADFITHRYEHARLSPTIPLVPTQTENSNGKLANTVAINIDPIERMDRIVMTMEARRNAAYREVERYRIGSGERLPRVAEPVEDAEFREVDDAPGEPQLVCLHSGRT
jgi:hypothetical protein